MRDISGLFWQSSIDEMKRGYVYDEKSEEYICLICGKVFSKGVIYQVNDMLYDAERAVRNHISDGHSSVFEYLLNMDKRLTGLTDTQRSLLSYFHMGLSDSEIVNAIGGGSTSTIRNHRFTLRQKEKQAKIFLALMELLEENKLNERQVFIDMHMTATMIDERYAITEEENKKILHAYFPDGIDGKLTEFPKKEKKKIAIMKNIMRKFDSSRKYTEKEVNQILEEIYFDYVTIRRYLIEYGFMDRHRDGSLYWVKTQ
jgi:hypothetical protein